MRPKRPIPGRVRAQEAKERARQNKVSVRWYGKPWPWMTATFGLIGWILLNNVTVLRNLEQLPETYQRTRDSLQAQYYDDVEWSGTWSTKAEGYVDFEEITKEVKLSPTDVRLNIQTERGNVGGTIATPRLCELIPFATSGLLFRGHVDGDRVIGIAFDYIGGREVKFASLTITRISKGSSVLLMIHSKDDDLEVFPKEAVILLHPESRSPNLTSDAAPYCGEYVKQTMNGKKNTVRRPIEQLHSSRRQQ